MNKQKQDNTQIQEMEDVINSMGFEHALFDTGLIDDLMQMDGFDDLYDTLPDWLTKLIDNGYAEYEPCFDRDYWGSASVVQVRIHCRVGDEKIDKTVEAWKDENEKFYGSWCSKAEALIWAHIQKQENFQVFDYAMKGKRV